MTMPNFLIIGAARSGTTALYQYLKQHPQIYMCPIKETNFFSVEGEKPNPSRPDQNKMAKRLMRRSSAPVRITDIETYRALFQGVSDELAIGEASPSYLIYSKAPERIKHHIPDTRLIAILRDPVERAYSAHIMRTLYGGEERAEFGQAIRDIHWGFYYTHLKRYFDIFDPAQIRVYLFEDLRTDPTGILGDIFQFLGVNETFAPDVSAKYNMGGVPKNKMWHILLIGTSWMKSTKSLIPATLHQQATNYLGNLQRYGLTKPPSLEPDARAELIQVYQEDILKLQDLIQRDLSRWLK